MECGIMKRVDLYILITTMLFLFSCVEQEKKEVSPVLSQKKNIGSVLALYPKPATVIGTMLDGKANFMMMTHTGIIGHDRIMLSMRKIHYSNKAARETRKLSVNIVDDVMLPRADYAGTVSGTNEYKSKLFEYTLGKDGMPIINDSPLTLECIV